MKIFSDGSKQVRRDDKQNYHFVGAHTNVYWNSHLEGTFYARNNYAQNKEWLDMLRDGKLYWYGEQFLDYFDDMVKPEIVSAKVQADYTREGNNSDDRELRA